MCSLSCRTLEEVSHVCPRISTSAADRWYLREPSPGHSWLLARRMPRGDCPGLYRCPAGRLDRPCTALAGAADDPGISRRLVDHWSGSLFSCPEPVHTASARADVAVIRALRGWCAIRLRVSAA